MRHFFLLSAAFMAVRGAFEARGDPFVGLTLIMVGVQCLLSAGAFLRKPILRAFAAVAAYTCALGIVVIAGRLGPGRWIPGIEAVLPTFFLLALSASLLMKLPPRGQRT